MKLNLLKAVPSFCFAVKRGQVIHKPICYKRSVARVSGYNSALCTHRDGDPAQDAPVGLCGFMGINALIEMGAGQFCKCWDIKKATFYYCSTKRPFIGAVFENDWIGTDLVKPSGQIPFLFTKSGRAGSWPAVHSMHLLWLKCSPLCLIWFFNRQVFEETAPNELKVEIG